MIRSHIADVPVFSPIFKTTWISLNQAPGSEDTAPVSSPDASLATIPLNIDITMTTDIA